MTNVLPLDSDADENEPRVEAEADVSNVSKPSLLRPATRSDIKLIHARLIEAIETSPFYSDEFKAFETSRLTKAYLAALIKADPHHVFVVNDCGQTCGFMISGPELGVLWLYWSYMFPEKRQNGRAMSCMRAFIEHWNNGKFHKISTYTRPENRVAQLLMKRFKFKLVCTLEQHIFGEDFMLYDRPLTKTSAGYDRGVGVGTIGKFKQRVREIFRL